MSSVTDSLFSPEQFGAIYPEGIERHYWNRCRNRVIKDMLRRIGAQGPMLEVGCGKGLVVSALRGSGIDIAGVELAKVDVPPDLAEHVRTGMDFKALDDSYASTVRTVLLLDVIEHIEDPKELIDGIRVKFPVLEWLVVTVPAGPELFSNYDRFNGHFRRYDLGSIRAQLDPGSSRPWRVGYFFHSLYPAAKVLLRLKGERRTYFSVPKKGLQSLMHLVLGALFYLEYKVLPRTWKGTSLITATRIN